MLVPVVPVAGHAAIVDLLCQCGANVGAVNDVGDTPLHLAAWKNHLACAEILVSNNADKNAVNKDGRTCAQLARSAELKKLLPGALGLLGVVVFVRSGLARSANRCLYRPFLCSCAEYNEQELGKLIEIANEDD